MNLTQHERIIDLLREQPSGVCGTWFLKNHIPTYSQRIGELRRDKGYTINTVPCPYSWHTHSSHIATYQLVAGIHAEQLNLEESNA